MKKWFLFFALAMSGNMGFSQDYNYKIVYDFTKDDTASFATMVRQTNSIMKASPTAIVEIVCHGPGLDLLISEKTTVKNEIAELAEKYHVVFAACETTMKRRKIERSQLVTQATPVPLASLEIAKKQQEGWSYIKAGN
ncbi:MAG TPA: DsrE family protein [Chitinophagaceae bacterium]|nr:DsrE family protein [Chitinophagaceae bacterium]